MLEPLPCVHCGFASVLQHDENAPEAKWSVRCPNRRNHVGKGRAVFGKTEEGCIRYWNLHQTGVLPAKRFKAATARDLTHCNLCGLRGEHVCLMGSGWARIDENFTASTRVRMG
jgi:hypothetical protein